MRPERGERVTSESARDAVEWLRGEDERMRFRRLLAVAAIAVVIGAGTVGPALAYTNGSRYLTVPCTTSCGQQDYTNWCGVASTHAVLHKLGKNIAQSTLATKYGVGKNDGSAVAIEKIPGVLNGYISGFDYVHVARSGIASVSSMKSVAQYCVDTGYLGIPCVNPYPYTNSLGQYSPGLPTYTGTSRGGHYIVIRGYNYTTSSSSIYYWDPHYNASHYGYHNTSATNFWKTMYYKNWGSQGVVY